MLHKDNKLDDAVELVAKATILRHDDENGFITDGPELVRIAGYTSWRRCSDPHVPNHPSPPSGLMKAKVEVLDRPGGQQARQTRQNGHLM